jgi:sialate O-acetylesterase
MKVEGGNMILKLDAADVGPYNDGPILGFAIAGKDGKFQRAKAAWGTRVTNTGSKQEDRSLIVLSSPLVAEPLYYRHGWGRNPLANLKADGIPLDTLRNDNWTITEMAELYTGKQNASTSELAKALKADDVKRRLNEAETFIKEHPDTSKAAQK